MTRIIKRIAEIIYGEKCRGNLEALTVESLTAQLKPHLTSREDMFDELAKAHGIDSDGISGIVANLLKETCWALFGIVTNGDCTLSFEEVVHISSIAVGDLFSITSLLNHVPELRFNTNLRLEHNGLIVDYEIGCVFNTPECLLVFARFGQSLLESSDWYHRYFPTNAHPQAIADIAKWYAKYRMTKQLMALAKYSTEACIDVTWHLPVKFIQSLDAATVPYACAFMDCEFTASQHHDPVHAAVTGLPPAHLINPPPPGRGGFN